jgi:hypothetical protein
MNRIVAEPFDELLPLPPQPLMAKAATNPAMKMKSRFQSCIVIFLIAFAGEGRLAPTVDVG